MRQGMTRRDFLKLGAAGVTGTALLGAAGCGSGGGSGGNQVLRLGHILSEDDPGDLGAVRFKEIVERETDGELEVRISGNSELGDEQELWEGLELGSVQMALTGVGPISFFAEQYAGVQMYYAIQGYEHLDTVFYGDIGEEIESALLEAQGGRVLDWWYRGPRHTTANKEIRTPDDVQGLKIRIPEGRTYLEAWQGLGANPTPVALEEVFSALEQGTIDAQENPLGLILTNSFDEVQSHVNMTGHQYAPYILAISNETWQNLSSDQQEVVREAAKSAGNYEKETVREQQGDFESELRDAGMTFVEDVDTEQFQDALQPVVERLERAGVWQEGLYERMASQA